MISGIGNNKNKISCVYWDDRQIEHHSTKRHLNTYFTYAKKYDAQMRPENSLTTGSVLARLGMVST